PTPALPCKRGGADARAADGLGLKQHVGWVERSVTRHFWQRSGGLRCAPPALRLLSSSLHRAVALDGDPVAGAGVRPIIPHRVVLDAAIVPERDRVLAPAEAALEQRVGHVLIQVAQDAVALVARDAVDVAGEA